MNTEMKIFAMDDYEYWIGPDAESCKAAFIKEYGEEGNEDIDPTEIPGHALNIDMSEEADGSGPHISAGEFLRLEVEKGGEFPRYAFASES